MTTVELAHTISPDSAFTSAMRSWLARQVLPSFIAAEIRRIGDIVMTLV